MTDTTAPGTASTEVSAPRPVVTFVQTWTMPSAEHVEGWLKTMHERIGALTGKPGFVSMSLHPSLDGTQVVVYAQWASRQDLEAARADPEAKAGHEALAQWGEDRGNVYRVDSVYLPSAPRV